MATQVNQKITPFWLLFVLTGLNLLNYLDRYVLSAVRTPLAAEFGLSYGESGRIFTTFMIGYFFTSPLFGYLGDRVSRKGLIAAGIFVWSLGTVLTGWAAGFGQLILFRVLVGVGEASYASVSPSLISDSYGPKRRNNALTVFYLAIPVGTALGFILGGAIAAHWGWRYAFLWAGAPGLLLAFVLLPFREPKRGEAEAVEGQTLTKPGVRDVFGLFKNSRYMLVVWGYVAYTFALGAFAFWGPTFLERVHHLPTDKAGSFMGGVIIFSGLVGPIGRVYGDPLAAAQPRRLCLDVGLRGCTGGAHLLPGFDLHHGHLDHGSSRGLHLSPFSLHGAGKHLDPGNRTG